MSAEKYIRKSVLKQKAYHLDVHPGIKLDQNESPWDLPVPIKAEIVEKLLQTPWNRYPLGDILSLKKSWAKTIGLWPDNLVFANGSNVLIQALIMATSLQGKVLIPDPCFSVYEIEGQLLDNEIIRIHLDEDFQIPVNNFVKAIKKHEPSIIFIPNPHAPCGTLYSKDVLRTIIETAQCLVVIDEAYYPFSGTTIIDWVKQYDNLVVLRTFSKALSLGGLRLGWMAAETEIANQVQKCLLPFCLSKLTHISALCVMENLEYVESVTQKICSERERVFNRLKNIPGLKVYPSATNFILIEHPDWKNLFKALLNDGIILRQVNDGRHLTQNLRVTIGTPEENDAFLSSITKIFTLAY